MPRDGKRPRQEYRERLEYQVQCRMDRKVFSSMDAARTAQQKAMRQFLKTGDTTVKGVKIIARWRNPEDRSKDRAEWRTTEDPGQSLEDFWKTLHKQRGALRGLAERYGL